MLDQPLVWGIFLTTAGVPNPILTGHSDVQVGAVGPGISCEARITLGIPDDLVIVQFTIRASAYSGYTYTCDATCAEMDTPPDAPGLLWVTPPDGPLPLVLWRRRVTCDGLALYLEARWAPGQGETITICGLEHDQRRASLLRVYQGLHLLKAVESGVGRPTQARYYTRDTFYARYPGAVAEARRQRGASPRNEDIAKALHLTLPTFERYLREYGRPPHE